MNDELKKAIDSFKVDSLPKWAKQIKHKTVEVQDIRAKFDAEDEEQLRRKNFAKLLAQEASAKKNMKDGKLSDSDEKTPKKNQNSKSILQRSTREYHPNISSLPTQSLSISPSPFFSVLCCVHFPFLGQTVNPDSAKEYVEITKISPKLEFL